MERTEAFNWEQAYLDHASAIRRYCSHYCKSSAEVDDLCQSVFLRAKEKEHLFKVGSSEKAWLYKLARNHALNKLRNQQRHKEIEAWAHSKSFYATTSKIHLVDDRTSPLNKIEKEDELHEIYNSLDSLTEEEREIILLKYVEGLSRSEIVEITGLSLSLVKKRLVTGMKSLRENFEKKL